MPKKKAISCGFKTKETEREKYLETGKQLEAGSNYSHEINHPDLQPKTERKQGNRRSWLGGIGGRAGICGICGVGGVAADGVVG